MERVRYLDLLRPLATGCVVYSHWILIGLTYYRGRFSDLNVLDHIEWGRWVTWAFSVMPAFFLVGGYANACPWTAHHAQESAGTGGYSAGMRLWWPTAVYLGVNALAIMMAPAVAVAPATIALVGRLSRCSCGSCRSTWC